MRPKWLTSCGPIICRSSIVILDNLDSDLIIRVEIGPREDNLAILHTFIGFDSQNTLEEREKRDMLNLFGNPVLIEIDVNVELQFFSRMTKAVSQLI